MCLNRRNRSVTLPIGQNWAWKVFYSCNQYGARSEYMTVNPLIPLGKWVNERDYRGCDETIETLPCDSQDWCYQKGFHCFLDVDEARAETDSNCIMKKVFFRNPVATGTQWNCRMVVAKEIYICKRQDQEKP